VATKSQQVLFFSLSDLVNNHFLSSKTPFQLLENHQQLSIYGLSSIFFSSSHGIESSSISFPNNVSNSATTSKKGHNSPSSHVQSLFTQSMIDDLQLLFFQEIERRQLKSKYVIQEAIRLGVKLTPYSFQQAYSLKPERKYNELCFQLQR
jgi:hypothetical protein